MKKIIILIPVYNDWKSLFKILENIEEQIKKWNAEVSVLVVNDASTEKKLSNQFDFKNIKSIRVINMKENKGHTKCNAVGLKYISEKEDYDYVIPMDGDGEDRPEELTLLFNKSKEYPNKVITANRVKRAEGTLFRFCYFMHKCLTFIFTGISIKFGNYTCLPKTIVINMVKEPSVWSSFSGSLAKLAKDRISIPSIRGCRYFGPSKMSFWSLLKHSLSIIAVFKRTVIARSVIFLLFYLFFVYQSFSIVTLIPVFSIIVLIYLVISLSQNEDINELNNSMDNINNIEKIN